MRQSDGTATGFGVRLRPEGQVPAEIRGGDWAVEHFVGDLWALYGYTTAEGLSVRTWTDLRAEDRASTRTVMTCMPLGRDFTPNHILGAIDDDLPVFTNLAPHP